VTTPILPEHSIGPIDQDILTKILAYMANAANANMAPKIKFFLFMPVLL